MTKDFKIDVYSHYFRLSMFVNSYDDIIERFMYEFRQIDWVKENGRNVQKEIKLFAVADYKRRKFKFHINVLKPFLDCIINRGITEDRYEVVYKDYAIPEKLGLSPKKGRVAKDYQIPAIDHITKPIDGKQLPSLLLQMPTGTGKTFSSLKGACDLNYRLGIVVLPMYMDKWADDLVANLDASFKNCMHVKGSSHLKGLIELAKQGKFKTEATIFSNRTMQNYWDFCDKSSDEEILDEYGVLPEDFWELLGIGNIIVDETHQHIYSVFSLMLHSHVKQITALSATLISDDPFITKIHKCMYPANCRYNKLAMEKYIKLFAVDYAFRDFSRCKIRISEFGSNNYSHNAFEKSILKNKRHLDSYLEMIYKIIVSSYITKYMPGDKLIVFASSIDMCTVMTNYFAKKFANLSVKRYVEKDPYENVIEPDIRVTTILSAGTAIDIPNLRVAIMTISISSSPANLQCIGRLRKLIDRDVSFYYTYCTDITKQVNYHLKRLDLFKDRISTLKHLRYGSLLD